MILPFALALLPRYVSAPRSAGAFLWLTWLLTIYGGPCIWNISLLKALELQLPKIAQTIYAGKTLLVALKYKPASLEEVCSCSCVVGQDEFREGIQMSNSVLYLNKVKKASKWNACFGGMVNRSQWLCLKRIPFPTCSLPYIMRFTHCPN